MYYWECLYIWERFFASASCWYFIILIHAVQAAFFCCIGKCVITPRRLVELKIIQRYNRREDGVDFVSMSENFGYHAPATPDGREELIQTV